MANMSMTKNIMPEQEPQVRRRNFDEVALGYSVETAVDEAKRCMQCKNKPCMTGCPVSVPIPAFIAKIAEGEFEEAYEIIKSTNQLPAVCGRVCPQERQCESKCVRGIKGESVGIGRLERFAADFHMANGKDAVTEITPNGHKVAVVGSGPAGLTCAGQLAKNGFEVTVFESLHTAGGVLMYGIPEFRLPKAIVQKEIDGLKALGVEIVTNCIVGKSITLDELTSEGYEAVFIGSGAGLPSFMNIPGEDSIGVFSANDFLTRVNLMKAYMDDYLTPIYPAKRYAVIGGGNVAMDAARCALRLGADEVSIVYRRSEAELPARLEEIHHAKEEGVEFVLLTAPLEVKADDTGRVKSLVCQKMELGEPDASGRRRPVPIEGSEYELNVDAVIVAIGNSPNPLLTSSTKGLDTDRRGCLVVEEGTSKTTREGVYAGGDAVTGAATVILAMGAGRDAANEIEEYILGK